MRGGRVVRCYIASRPTGLSRAGGVSPLMAPSGGSRPPLANICDTRFAFAPAPAAGTMPAGQFSEVSAMSPKILILSASVGAGHMRAAEAVELAVRELAPDA